MALEIRQPDALKQTAQAAKYSARGDVGQELSRRKDLCNTMIIGEVASVAGDEEVG